MRVTASSLRIRHQLVRGPVAKKTSDATSTTFACIESLQVAARSPTLRVLTATALPILETVTHHRVCCLSGPVENPSTSRIVNIVDHDVTQPEVLVVGGSGPASGAADDRPEERSRAVAHPTWVASQYPKRVMPLGVGSLTMLHGRQNLQRIHHPRQAPVGTPRRSE